MKLETAASRSATCSIHSARRGPAFRALCVKTGVGCRPAGHWGGCLPNGEAVRRALAPDQRLRRLDRRSHGVQLGFHLRRIDPGRPVGQGSHGHTLPRLMNNAQKGFVVAATLDDFATVVATVQDVKETLLSSPYSDIATSRTRASFRLIVRRPFLAFFFAVLTAIFPPAAVNARTS